MDYSTLGGIDMNKGLKRVLSIILSLTMVICIAPINAYADEYTNINSAMSAFEAKLNSNTVYKNMTSAYNAYVNCQKGLDAYRYGDNTSVNLNNLATNLNNASANMTVWSRPSASGIGYYGSYNSGATGVLYSSTDLASLNGDGPNLYISGSGIVGWSKIVMPTNVVLLYDGVTNAGFPVSQDVRRNISNDDGLVAISTWSANTNFKFTKNWAGYYTGTQNETVWQGQSGSQQYNYIYSTATSHSVANGGGAQGNARYWYNMCYYAGTGNNVSYYDSYSNLEFGFRYYGSNGNYGYNTSNLVSQGNVYVINYKPVLDKINNSTYRSYIKNVNQYKEGQLSFLISAYDNATNLNPNSYSYSSSPSSYSATCASAISSAISKFNSIGTPSTDSSGGYAKLRSAIDNANKIGGTNPVIRGKIITSTRYTSDSWDNYFSYYDSAKASMRTLALTGYNNQYAGMSVSDIASNLNNAINNLKYNYIVQYTHTDGTIFDECAYAEGSTINITNYENSPVVEGSIDNGYKHTRYYWNFLTISRASLGDVETVTETEYASTESCLYGASERIKDPTCTDNGQEKYVCLSCGGFKTVDVDALGHNYVENDVESTCTHGGYTEHICTRCNDGYNDNETEQLPHNYTSTVINPTCTKAGYTINICKDCGIELINNYTEKLKHSYITTDIASTCTDKGYTADICAICGDTIIDEDSYINELGHSLIQYEIVPANCVSVGVMEYACQRCDAYYQEYIDIDCDKHGEMLYARTVAPSDTDDGYDIYYCSNLCGYWEKKNIVLTEKEADFDSYLEAYNNAIEATIDDFEPYTADSISLYNSIICEAKNNASNAVASRDIVLLERCTTQIIEATSVLRIKTVRIDIVLENNVDTQLVEYGSSFKININKASKITIEEDGITSLLCYDDNDINLVAHNDAIINIYNIESCDISNKITLLDNNGKVIDIVYSNNTPDLSSNMIHDVSAPKIPFYQFDSWKIVDNQPNTYQATYKA